VIFERYFASKRIRQCKVGHHSNPEEPKIINQGKRKASLKKSSRRRKGRWRAVVHWC